MLFMSFSVTSVSPWQDFSLFAAKTESDGAGRLTVFY